MTQNQQKYSTIKTILLSIIAGFILVVSIISKDVLVSNVCSALSVIILVIAMRCLQHGDNGKTINNLQNYSDKNVF
jgi:uncharacterized membrane protein